METDYNPSRLLYRYQNQTEPSTWEIYKILTDSKPSDEWFLSLVPKSAQRCDT